MEQQEALQLKDIHLPGSPGFWPPAMGWWLLLVLAFFALFWTFARLKKRNRIRKRRKELLNTLGKLEDKLRKDANNETLAEVNTLLRQLAVNYYPRSEIASLTGGDWLHFLDQSGDTRGFSRGAGRVLIDAPYQLGKIQNFNIDEFIPLVRHWVKKTAQSGGCHLINMLTSIEFASLWVFWLLPLPLIARFLLPAAPVNSNAALRVPFYKQLSPNLQVSKKGPSWLRLFLAFICWILLVTAAARPQLVGDTVRQPVTGRSLMMSVDISMSMDEPDMIISGRRMTRISAVKAVASDFIQKREGDRIGLILFGSQAYLQAPLTFDRKTVSILLEESFLGLAGRATAIGDAIGLAVKRLRNEDEKNRVLILLTDGANTAGNVEPLKAADLAAQENVKIYTIGVGSMGSRDLDEPTLEAIAEKTGGRYFRARDVEGLLKIYKALDEIEPVSKDELSYRPVDELFYYPLAVALGLSSLIVLFSSSLMSGLMAFFMSFLPGSRKKKPVQPKEVI